MKVKVTEVFQDKYTKRLYQVGDVIDVTDKERLKVMTEKKLVQVAEDEVVTETKKPATKKRKAE